MSYNLLQFLFSARGVTVFIWTTLVLGAGFAFSHGQWATLSVILLTLFFTAVPTMLAKWYAIRLPRIISLLIVLFAYASLFLGEIHDFYELFAWWDVALHMVSAMIFGLIGLGTMRMMQSAKTINAIDSVVAIFGFTFALAIGATWEIFEFTLDSILGFNHMQKSLEDTMGDLIVDGLGAAIVSIFGYLHWKFGRANFIGQTIEHFIERYKNRVR
jgi:hypothetical protein